MVSISKCAKEWLRLKNREFIITVLLICVFGFFVTFHVRRFVSGDEGGAGKAGELAAGGYTAQEYRVQMSETEEEAAAAGADTAENRLFSAEQAADAGISGLSSSVSGSEGTVPAEVQSGASQIKTDGTKGNVQTKEAQTGTVKEPSQEKDVSERPPEDRTGQETKKAPGTVQDVAASENPGKQAESRKAAAARSQEKRSSEKRSSEKESLENRTSKTVSENKTEADRKGAGKTSDGGSSAGASQAEGRSTDGTQKKEKKEDSPQTDSSGKGKKTEAAGKGQTGKTAAGLRSRPFSLQADSSKPGEKGSAGKRTDSTAGGAAFEGAKKGADSGLGSVPAAAALSGEDGTEPAVPSAGREKTAGETQGSAAVSPEAETASEGTREELTEQDYRQELADTEALVEQLKNSGTDTSTWSYLNMADYELKLWDDELNAIYKDIISRLDTEEAEALKKEEREWIRKKDEEARKAASRYKGGTLEGLEHTASLAKSTRERAYALLDSYGSCLPQEETQ